MNPSSFFFAIITILISFSCFSSSQVKIHYQEFGSGPSIIILNGGPGRSSETFIPLAKKISEMGFRTVIFDQRGTGKSTAELTEASINLSSMIEDLEDLRIKLNLEKIILLGHSFGGMYAMAYANKYPDRIEKLILSASGGIDQTWRNYVSANFKSRLSAEDKNSAEKLENIISSKKEQGLDTTEDERALTTIYAQTYVYNKNFVPQIISDLTNTKYFSLKVNNLVWKSMKNFDLKDSMNNFKAPTLVLAGRQDILGEEVPLTIHKHIKQSKLEFINECSHYPWLDQPKIYFELIEDFLKISYSNN